MRQNIDKTLYLDDLAKLSHVSKYHFSRRYHALTGMTPLQHFSHIKIEHASTLLEQTSLSISDIAYQLGYDDALYFSRVFKKQMKLSPRAYRKRLLLQK
jgi:transcriptional regulator GlxA family with amidase domain